MLYFTFQGVAAYEDSRVAKFRCEKNMRSERFLLFTELRVSWNSPFRGSKRNETEFREKMFFNSHPSVSLSLNGSEEVSKSLCFRIMVRNKNSNALLL
jgi:hypothetical protein